MTKNNVSLNFLSYLTVDSNQDSVAEAEARTDSETHS